VLRPRNIIAVLDVVRQLVHLDRAEADAVNGNAAQLEPYRNFPELVFTPSPR